MPGPARACHGLVIRTTWPAESRICEPTTRSRDFASYPARIGPHAPAWSAPCRAGGAGHAQKLRPVLAIAAVVLTLFAIGSLLVAAIALFALKRLRLDAWTVLEWLGLAEAQHPRPPLRPLPTPASRRSAAAPGT